MLILFALYILYLDSQIHFIGYSAFIIFRCLYYINYLIIKYSNYIMFAAFNKWKKVEDLPPIVDEIDSFENKNINQVN